ncbi:hypothetical protein LEMLEM_LOCUS20626 [Lemmus lemmus]
MPVQPGPSARGARGPCGERAASAESGAAGEGSEVCKQYGGASAALCSNFGLFFRARVFGDRGGEARRTVFLGPGAPPSRRRQLFLARRPGLRRLARSKEGGKGKKKPIGDRPRPSPAARRPAPPRRCFASESLAPRAASAHSPSTRLDPSLQLHLLPASPPALPIQGGGPLGIIPGTPRTPRLREVWILAGTRPIGLAGANSPLTLKIAAVAPAIAYTSSICPMGTKQGYIDLDDRK